MRVKSDFFVSLSSPRREKKKFSVRRRSRRKFNEIVRFAGVLVLLAAGLLTSTFRFIPKATLAGLIICAMYYMLDFTTYKLLWQAKSESTIFFFQQHYINIQISMPIITSTMYKIN